MRRSAGHVEATAFIWGALLPLLERGVRAWSELKAWLDGRRPACAARSACTPSRANAGAPAGPPGRVPLPAAQRRRALRRQGGEPAQTRGGPLRAAAPPPSAAWSCSRRFTTCDFTETPSLLEAALLETDEIKRLDPPYNVQLRGAERQAWYASSDLREASPRRDAVHRVGPLPSQHALLPLAALTALVDGAGPSPALSAAALAVPAAFAPPPALFDEGFRAFVADTWAAPSRRPRRDGAASRALWLLRGRAEPDADAEADARWARPTGTWRASAAGWSAG